MVINQVPNSLKYSFATCESRINLEKTYKARFVTIMVARPMKKNNSRDM